MRWVFLFISIVAVLDGIVLLAFTEQLIWMLFIAFFLVIGNVCYFLPRLKKDQVIPLQGWSLGEGENLTDPDQSVIEEVVIAHSVLCLGFLALGGPGSGKSESVAIGYMKYISTDQDRGFSFFCGKGQKDVYQKALAAGITFDYFFSSELPDSDDINLMEGEAHQVIDRLCGLLIGHTQSTTFYADEQRAVLSTMVPLLKALQVPVNLRDLYTLLTVEAASVEVMRRVRALDHIEQHIPELADKFFSQKHEQRMMLMRGLLNRMSEFVLGPMAVRLNAYQPTISIESCIQNNKRIYWHFPLSETSKAIATAITDMIQAVAMKRQQESGDHTLYPLIYDDWGDFFYSRFGAMAARCRSVNMPLSFLFQSSAQLDKVSVTFKDELDDTVATKIALRLMGDNTGQYIADKFGQFETLELSQHGNDGGEISQAKQARNQPRLKVEQLKDLDVGEAYINTIERRKGQSENKFYRAQFPLIETTGWQFKDWPKKPGNKQGVGLNLWDQFIGSKAKSKAIKSEIKRFIEVNH